MRSVAEVVVDVHLEIHVRARAHVDAVLQVHVNIANISLFMWGEQYCAF